MIILYRYFFDLILQGKLVPFLTPSVITGPLTCFGTYFPCIEQELVVINNAELILTFS